MDVSGTNILVYALHSIIQLICSMIIFFSRGHIRDGKMWLGVLYIIVLSMISFALFIMIRFEPFINIGDVRVKKSEMSPNSVYLAEVIADDQGALGGSTIVTVTRQYQNINLFIVKLIKDSKVIYKGNWGEFNGMTLTWETDKIIYINEVKYKIR